LIERRHASRGVRTLYPLDRRRDRRPLFYLGILTLALLGIRAVSLLVVAQPGYTDAYYYATVASRLAHGEGLSADFVWNFIEAPRFAALPVPSHRFWMPLASLLQAGGIVALGGPLGDFRAGQLAVVAVAGLIPLVTYAAARSLGASAGAALLGAAVAGLGGAFAPAWVSLDSFAPAAAIGTLFFVALARAARGSVRAGALAGLLVGLLYLARAEGALFGIALLWLAGRRGSARAGVTGSAVALAIGVAWLARGVMIGFPEDLVARSVLLVRYQDFFAVAPPTLEAFLAAPIDLAAARASALLTNAVTAAMALLIAPLFPLVVAVRRRWALPEVRAFVGLFVLVYLAQSLLFTLHSVRGSFFHSLAAFFPFAVALAAAGTQDLFVPASRRLVTSASLAAFGVVSAFALGQWDVDFNTPYRARLAALSFIPPGPLVVTDAAAWRWISGRTAVLAPADGERLASCAAEVYLAPTLVLEPAHFSAYDDLYRSQRSDLFSWQAGAGGIRVYSVRPGARCILANGP